jgi:RimJ/RimL family protein N-acetyltransferase
MEYFYWMNDKQSNRFIEGTTKSLSLDDVISYVEEKNNSTNALLMGIFDKKSGKHIGNVKLEPIDIKSSSAWFGILIGNLEFRGRGFAKEIIDTFLETTFLNLGIKTFYLGVNQENIPAINVYQRCGFHEFAHQKNGGIHMVKHMDKIINLEILFVCVQSEYLMN